MNTKNKMLEAEIRYGIHDDSYFYVDASFVRHERHCKKNGEMSLANYTGGFPIIELDLYKPVGMGYRTKLILRMAVSNGDTNVNWNCRRVETKLETINTVPDYDSGEILEHLTESRIIHNHVEAMAKYASRFVEYTQEWFSDQLCDFRKLDARIMDCQFTEPNKGVRTLKWSGLTGYLKTMTQRQFTVLRPSRCAS